MGLYVATKGGSKSEVKKQLVKIAVNMRKRNIAKIGLELCEKEEDTFGDKKEFLEYYLLFAEVADMIDLVDELNEKLDTYKD